MTVSLPHIEKSEMEKQYYRNCQIFIQWRISRMDYLKDCYKFFRPLLQELLASNIDFSKAEPEKAEMEIIKKWVNVNLWGEDTAMDYAKDFFYKRIDEDWEQEIERSGSSEEDSSDQAVYIRDRKSVV